MSDRTWSDIGNEIRDDYLRDDGPENVRFRETQWEVWIAEVKRAAAAQALEEAAGQIFLPAQGPAHYIDIGMAERMSADWLRARAEAYRQERGE